VAVPDTLRLAFRSALDAHARAAAVHERAAATLDGHGKHPAADLERRKAEVERVKAATAEAEHPDWL
jgi:hypothetical protein